jgi:hypothetical protein
MFNKGQIVKNKPTTEFICFTKEGNGVEKNVFHNEVCGFSGLALIVKQIIDDREIDISDGLPKDYRKKFIGQDYYKVYLFESKSIEIVNGKNLEKVL